MPKKDGMDLAVCRVVELTPIAEGGATDMHAEFFFIELHDRSREPVY